MDWAKGDQHNEDKSVSSAEEKLHVASFCSESHDDVNMNDESGEFSEDGGGQGQSARQMNGGIKGVGYDPEGAVCDPERPVEEPVCESERGVYKPGNTVCESGSSECDPGSTVSGSEVNDDGGNNVLVSPGAPFERSQTDRLPSASHGHQESRHPLESDLAADLSKDVCQSLPSDHFPSVSSSSDQHEPFPSPQCAESELSHVYSTHDANQSDVPCVSVSPVLPRDSSPDVLSSGVSTPVSSHPVHLPCPHATQGSPDHGVGHSDASDGDSHNDTNGRREASGDIVCDADAVQERHTPLSESECGDSVTDLSSQTVSRHLLPEGAEDSDCLSLSATADKQESAGLLKDGRVVDRCPCSGKTDVAECSAVQRQSVTSSDVEVTSAISHTQHTINNLEEGAKVAGGTSDSLHQSMVGVSGGSGTASVASCTQQSDAGHDAGISTGDSCVPASAHSAVSDSCVQETFSHSAVQAPDKAAGVQVVDKCPVTVSQPLADSCLQGNTDSAEWTPAGKSLVQETSNLAAAFDGLEISSVSTPSAQSTGQSDTTKPVHVLNESVVTRPVDSCSSESIMTNTSSKLGKTSATSMASEEDAGSSVDPEIPVDEDVQDHQSQQLLHPETPLCEDVQGKAVQLSGEGHSSDSSENEFEDVTSTLTEGVEHGGHGGKKERHGEGGNVSRSDEGSDDDDFFDACDEQSEQHDKAEPHGKEDQTRRCTDGGDERDHHPESESQSSRIGNADHDQTNDLFHYQEKAQNARQEEHPGAPESSTSTTATATTTSGRASYLRSSGISGSRRSRRTWIPEKPHISLSLWGVLKNCIGKELSKIPMPVNFSEPLSMLQRLSEELEYSEILDQAAQCEDPREQLAHVAAFTVSAYATTQFRTAKPFNPLLGETFEFDRTEDLGWRSFAEQVSHHPPALATHAEGRGWTLWQDFTMTIRFRGRYVQIIPMGMAHLKFSRSGHHYTWRKVTTTVHNIIVGRLWVDNEGLMDIHNHTTGDVCHLNYQAYSYFSRQPHRKVTGEVKDGQGVVRWTLTGTWNSHMEAAPVLPTGSEEEEKEKEEEEQQQQEEEEEEEATSSCYGGITTDKASSRAAESSRTGASRVLWRVRPPPEGSEKIYHFSQLAIEMNEPEEGVAPTDSRRRPDQRKMEEGDWEEANRLKYLLEEKQRDTRRQRQAEAESAQLQGREVPEYQPVWFRKEADPITGNSLHVFTGDYWKCKEARQWDRCPDIFL